MPFLDVQAERREQAANRGEFGEVIVGHDRDLKSLVRLFGKANFARMLRCQLSRQSDVLGNRRRLEPPEVFLVHAGEEILKHIGWNVGTERTNCIEERCAVGRAYRHRLQYTRTGFIVRRGTGQYNAAP